MAVQTVTISSSIVNSMPTHRSQLYLNWHSPNPDNLDLDHAVLVMMRQAIPYHSACSTHRCYPSVVVIDKIALASITRSTFQNLGSFAPS